MTTGNPTVENYNTETRFALMEQSIKHIDAKLDSSMQHMSQSLQRLETTLENRFDKIDARFEKIDQRFEKVDREIRANLFWNITMVAGVLGVVAHALHWF